MDKSKTIEEIQKIDLLLYNQMLVFSPDQWEKYETSTKEYYTKCLCCSSFEAENSGFVKDIYICCGMVKEISNFIINTNDVTLYKLYIEKLSATSEELLQNLKRLSKDLGKDFSNSLYIKNLLAIHANLRHLHEWAKIYHSKVIKKIMQQSANKGQNPEKQEPEKRTPFAGNWEKTKIINLFNELVSKNYIAKESDMHWFLCAFGCSEDNATTDTEAMSKTTWAKIANKNGDISNASLLYLLDTMGCNADEVKPKKVNQWFVPKGKNEIGKHSFDDFNRKSRICDQKIAQELDKILGN